MESCKSFEEPDLDNSHLWGPVATPFYSVLPFWGQTSVESLSSQLHRSLHYDLILISRYASISLLPNSTPISISLSMTHLVCFVVWTFFNHKITRLLSPFPRARFWKSSVIKRKSPSSLILSFFFLLLFLLCGRHSTSGVNIINVTATIRYCEHINDHTQQVL